MNHAAFHAILRARLFALGAVTVFAFATVAQAEPKTELLWPAGAPGAKGDSDNDKPTIRISLPPADKANGAAVVVCPGGGYQHLAITYEGNDVGDWLNSQGVAALVLTYRHKGSGYQHPAPLQDAQRAIRTARARASELNIDPEKIGILGFSAGGHLASSAGTHFDAGQIHHADPIERVSSRPDFLVLCYPVISFVSPQTHQGSKKNLLGDSPDAKLVETMSSELAVTKDTPPTFIFHTNADTGVPPENAILFYSALRKAGVPAELHIYEKGPHGVGLGAKFPAVATWPGLCADWMKNRGLLEKEKK